MRISVIVNEKYDIEREVKIMEYKVSHAADSLLKKQ
jgi:hypothetical protein